MDMVGPAVILPCTIVYRLASVCIPQGDPPPGIPARDPSRGSPQTIPQGIYPMYRTMKWGSKGPFTDVAVSH